MEQHHHYYYYFIMPIELLSFLYHASHWQSSAHTRTDPHNPIKLKGIMLKEKRNHVSNSVPYLLD